MLRIFPSSLRSHLTYGGEERLCRLIWHFWRLNSWIITLHNFAAYTQRRIHWFLLYHIEFTCQLIKHNNGNSWNEIEDIIIPFERKSAMPTTGQYGGTSIKYARTLFCFSKFFVVVELKKKHKLWLNSTFKDKWDSYFETKEFYSHSACSFYPTLLDYSVFSMTMTLVWVSQ